MKAIGNYLQYHVWEITLVAFLKLFSSTNSNKSTNHNQSSCPWLSTQNIIRNIMLKSAHKTQSVHRHVLRWYPVALNTWFCQGVLNITLNAYTEKPDFKNRGGALTDITAFFVNFLMHSLKRYLNEQIVTFRAKGPQ